MSESTTSILGVAVRDINRFRTVCGIVARHGFGEILTRSPVGKLLDGAHKVDPGQEVIEAPAAVRFKRLLEALGPTYIKLGQILSMRPDRLPPDYIQALQALQDDTPVLPFEQIRAVVEEGLGKPIEVLFADFDPKALGTASIAQTHLATTHQGERVVVKVQRPGIEAIMRGDLDLLYIGARILEATIEEMDLYSPSQVVAEFEKALVQELNFAFELSNLVTARELLDPNRRATAPRPFKALSCKTVLVMEFFEGRPLRKLEPRSNEARHAVEELLHMGLKNVFVDGFFHGDPHSGNILVGDDGTVCAIDWGQVGRLNTAQREDLVTLILAAITNDVDTLARILLKMGTPTERVNMAEFKAEIRRIKGEQLEVANLDEYDSGQFIQEFALAAQRFRIKLNSEYSVLTKAAGTLEGIVAALHPEVDITGIARLYAEPIIRARLTPQKLVEEAMSGVTGVGSLIRHLPSQLDQVLHDIETGNVQVRALTPGLTEVAPTLHQVASRLCMALFAASMSVCTALLLPDDPTRALGVPWLSLFCLTMAVSCWTILWWWHFVGMGKPVRVSPLIKFFKRG